MALKDRFNNFENIEDLSADGTQNPSMSATTLVEADLGPVFDELALSLSQKVVSIPVWFEYSEAEQRKLISDFLIYKLENEYSDISFSNEEKEHIISLFMNSVHGFGELDYFISKDDVRAVCVNSDGSIFTDRNSGFVKEDAVLTDSQFEKLYSAIRRKINKPDMLFGQIRLNKLVITLFSPPVCHEKILFEKLKTEKVDFKFLLADESINSDIYKFIKKLIDEKKNILIAAPASAGKTALISAISNEINQDNRVALFENYPIINSEICDSYYIKGLDENGLSDLFNAVSKLKYDYVINDTEYMPVVLSEYFGNGYFADVEADSLTQAITKLAGYKVYNEKCTEKQAKAYIASRFNYIFLLQKSENSLFKIASVVELSLNKSGSLILTENLKYEDGSYWYNFDDAE
mgnify:CR=1 FL=1